MMRLGAIALLAVFPFAFWQAPAGGGSHGTVNFTSAGQTSWTVPAGVTSITVKCWGGGGIARRGQKTNTEAAVPMRQRSTRSFLGPL